MSAALIDLERRAEIVMDAWSKSLSPMDRSVLEAMETREESARRNKTGAEDRQTSSKMDDEGEQLTTVGYGGGASPATLQT